MLLLDARPSRPILAVKEITYIQALRLNTCRNRIYMSFEVYILPTLKLIFVQAVLNTVVYQVLMKC